MSILKPRWELICEQIQVDFLKGGCDTLPSIAHLSKHYHAGTGTVWRAVRHLADTGILKCTQGRKTSVSSTDLGKASNPGPRVSKSAKSLHKLLKKEIASGTRLIGQNLPKFDYLVTTYHISRAGANEAMRLLEKDGLAHKNGKRWVIGARKRYVNNDSFSNPRISPRPVFVVLCVEEKTWRNSWLWSQGVYYPFAEAFRREMEHSDNQLSRAFLFMDDPAIPWEHGHEFALRHIESLGEQFAGMLLFRVSGYIEKNAHVYPWCDWLCEILSRGKPVVCLEPNEDRSSLTRHIVKRRAKNYAYCRLDENAAVKTALTAMARLGHKKAAYPIWREYQGNSNKMWIKKRGDFLKRNSAALPGGPRIEFVFQDEDPLYWDALIKDEHEFRAFFAEKIERMEKDTKFSDKLVIHNQVLRQCSPSLAYIVDNPEITALIAPNDKLARIYSVWLENYGVQIPRDLSIISFDNDPLSSFNSLSTVDFGIDRLGYLAAHFLLGDLYIQTSSHRELFGTCRLIDKGSLAAP